MSSLRLRRDADPAVNSDISFIPKTPQEAFKAILVIAVTLFAAVRASLSGDGVISPIEGVQLLIQAVTLIPVFLLAGTIPKTIAAFLLAGLQALIPAIGALAGWTAWADITFDDYAGAILAAMLAIGIAVIPNAPAPNDTPREVLVVNEAAPTVRATFQSVTNASTNPNAERAAPPAGGSGVSRPSGA